MIWYRLPWICTTQPWRCRTSGTLHETCVEAGTRLHSGALPPSHIDVLACLLPGPHPLQLMGAQLCPHLCLDASVKRVISVCKALGETPCSTAGEAHPATWWRMVGATEILSDQDPVSWHQASDAHHWIGQKQNWPLGTRVTIKVNMPKSLWRSLAVTRGCAISSDPACSGFWSPFWAGVSRCRCTYWITYEWNWTAVWVANQTCWNGSPSLGAATLAGPNWPVQGMRRR